MVQELTDKQKKVLEFIQAKVHENIPPTIREIARELGFSSTGTVRDYLDALEKKGYLKRGSNKSRAIGLLNDTAFNRIPIVSTIAAGSPSLAYEDVLGYIEPADLIPRNSRQEDVFALKVKGDSMVDAGIMDGDIAIIKRQAVAANGEIIAALLEDNEVTLKKLRHKDSKTFLEPANRNYQPIHRDFTIIGKVISVLRKYF